MKYDIPESLIEDYIFSKFHDYKLYTNELVANSPFPDGDEKPRFSINLSTGLWRVFGTTSRQGNIFHLYSHLERVTYKQAVRRFLYKSLDGIDLLSSKPMEEEVIRKSTGIPKDWIEITLNDVENTDPDVQLAFTYLLDRKLFDFSNDIPVQKYYITKEGDNQGRLIIPLMEDGEMFFWTARDLVGSVVKYMHSPKEKFTKASHILYPFDYGEPYVVICEGIFDAIALQLQGVNSTCVFGASCSNVQLEMLKEYGGRLVSGFDTDPAGIIALERLEKTRKRLSMNSLFITVPPDNCKDWCEAHEKDIDLLKHITNNTVLYDFYYISINSL
jgi:hypothetical protein